MSELENFDYSLLERFDNFAALRNQLRKLSAGAAEWAGIPIPIEGEHLVVSPSYPFAEIFNSRDPDEDPEPGEPTYSIRNNFYSRRKRCNVIVVQNDATGEIRHVLDPMKSLDCELRTLGCSFAWGIEQEAAALQTLAGHLRHHQFKTYLLCGGFVESSERTGIVYLFRKLRPTVALKAHGKGMRIMAALCMHPIGYYEGSWAGAMCPTDDVIAHLMLMRGDEPKFWQQSNQHPAWRPEAGVHA